MEIRAFRTEDAAQLAGLAASCARSEGDFVLNPLWESEDELLAEFRRHGIAPEEHLLVADADTEGILGLVGFLRAPGARAAGMICPIVQRGERGRGLGGRLVRAGLELASKQLGIELASAAIGTRNRAGYALLTAFGFRPIRQVFVMRTDTAPKRSSLPIEGLNTRPAASEDAAAILEIYTSCGFPARAVEHMESNIVDGRHTHNIAHDEQGRIVAFVELETHWPRRPWVAFVGVEPALRDRGLGSTLVAQTLADRFDSGSTAALLTLSPANRTAVRAYEKVGFRRWRLVDVLEKTI